MKYLSFGINLTKAAGTDHHILPVPAVYLIDKGLLIHYMYANPNYKIRLNDSVLLQAAKAI